MADDQGPAPGAVNDDDSPALQVGLPLHLRLGPQVGGQQQATISHRLRGRKSAGTGNSSRPRLVSRIHRAMPGFRVRQFPFSNLRML